MICWMKTRSWGWAGINLLLCWTLTACVPLLQPPAAGAPQLQERKCGVYLPKGEVEGETIHCGFVRVRWDHTRPGSAAADLAYVVLKATGANPRPDAIVHIAGGPGVGATLRDVVPEMVQRYAPLRVDRDIILYDQRGMGHSQPFFSCPYPDEAQAATLQRELAAGATPPISDAAVANAFCQQELASQPYPASGISTAASAADLVDVMAALGYPAYNLYGVSYGTRLAMALLHAFPSQPLVRSVVLDSPYPLPEDKVNDYIAAPLLDQQALFESVFAACADDPACASDYPDLRTRFDALVAKLNAAPLQLGDGQSLPGDDLYRMVYPFNSALNYIPYQPRLIDELERGVTTTLTLLRSGQVPARTMVTGTNTDVEGFSTLLDAFLACTADTEGTAESDEQLVSLWDAEAEAVKAFVSTLCPGDRAAAVNQLVDGLPAGAFNGIITRFAPEPIQGVNSALNSKLSCTEQYPFREDPAQIEAKLRAAGLPAFFVQGSLAEMASRGDGCSAWQDALARPTPTGYGSYPVLILNGQFDNVTPLAMGRIAAAELPGAQLVAVPNAMHSILGNHGACPTQMVQQFLAAPGQPVDTSCTEQMKVQFLAPTGSLPAAQTTAAPPKNDPENEMPQIPAADNTLVLRTDFADDGAWESICAAIQEPAGDFQAHVDCVSDAAFADMSVEQILAAVPQGWNHSFLFVVDQTTLAHPDSPILAVDVLDEPGRSLRVIPAAAWAVENNLSLGNMDFAEFAGAVDADGIFRGFAQ